MEPWSDVNVEWNDVPAFDPGTPDSPDIDSDGEDRRERNDYNIEKDAMNFVDEPPMKHNLYPETESDEEADVEENQRKEVQRTIYRRDQFRRGSGELFVGQVFINGIAFKEAVLDYALKTGRNIKQNRYDRTKIGFVCEGKGCSWRVYVSVARLRLSSRTLFLDFRFLLHVS
ncbi:SWAP (Suppressor-of-White-APricot)/surp RNA-binding domain-containing protein [Raphanus sativus]|nr:SWAP (Suppressor-of-White-APricot)/surp RNA-binding domain-containing protein [Raphanus sativus]